MLYLLRVPSSVQQQSSATVLSASTYFIVRVLSCVICILPHLGIPLFLFVYSFSTFFVVLISRVAFLVLLSYPSR